MKPIAKTKMNVVQDTLDAPRHEMTIRMTGKVFEMLSATLYSNKVRAIIRELSTNAWDSHIEAGNAHLDFDVQLPTYMNSKFRIRDYGVGMTEEMVFETYNCLFASTKTSSNDVTGMIGLGSKTPFAYTDQVTVTSYQNGTVKVFNSLIGDNGIPAMRKVFESPTNEPDGLAVEFTVQSSDRDRFIQEAKNVYPMFRRGPKPNFLNTGLSGEELRGKLEEVTQNVYIMTDVNSFPSTEYDAYVIQGNVAYPMEGQFLTRETKNILERLGRHANNKHSGYRSSYSRYELLFFEVPIGTVEFTPNREQLEGSRENYARIDPFIQNLEKHFVDHYSKKYGHLKTEKDAMLYKYSNDVVAHYFDAVMRESGLETRCSTRHLESEDLKDTLPKLDIEWKKANADVNSRYHSKNIELEVEHEYDKSAGKYTNKIVKQIISIRFNEFLGKNLKVILKDENKRFRSRIKNFLDDKSQAYILINNWQETVALNKLMEFFKDLNVDLLKVSDMPDNYVAKKSSKKRVSHRWFNEPAKPMGNQDLKTLDQLGVDENKPFYFVINSGGAVNYNGNDLDAYCKRSQLVKHGIISGDNPIVAIAHSRPVEKVLEAFPNAKPLGQAANDGFAAKYNEADVIEQYKYSLHLYRPRTLNSLDKIFDGLDDKDILDYNLGAEYIKIRDGQANNIVDELGTCFKFSTLYPGKIPTEKESELFKFDQLVRSTYPLIEAVSPYSIRGTVQQNLREFLKK